MMNSVILLPACGLYDELYDPKPTALYKAKPEINSHGCLDANTLFWATILSDENIKLTTTHFCERFPLLNCNSISHRAVLADPSAFISRLQTARLKIVDHGNTPQEFYSYLETLNIFCNIYAKLNHDGFYFNIQSGWQLNEISSEEIYENCLDSAKNPYLDFIQTVLLPILTQVNLKVIFLSGRPGYFSFAFARLVKEINPSIFLCITRHSSEYYSLNKIDHLLIRNTYLFRDFDAVILEHFFFVEQELTKAIIEQKSIENISNLVLKTSSGILHTGYLLPSSSNDRPLIRTRELCDNVLIRIPPHRLANVHLLPHLKCHWNKCTFCGINQKYHFETPLRGGQLLTERLNELGNLIDQGVSHIWFIDEAISPNYLREIAEYFASQNSGICWQARCRIDSELLSSNLVELLAASGLRELRLGLESGSSRILKKMNKFDDTFSFSLLDKICRKYSSCGISLHFPIIIGFPGETEDDRQETYDLLIELTSKYPLVTFNINIFGLDISSAIYKDWKKFGIANLSFSCDPDYFLGNLVQWDGLSSNMATLSREQSNFMRERLYPWMPTRSLTPPYILYRLSETIRDTLFWKNQTGDQYRPGLQTTHLPRHLKTGDITILSDESEGLYYIYSWSSHHYMIGNTFVKEVLELCSSSTPTNTVINSALKGINQEGTIKDIELLIHSLVSYQYLLSCESYAI